MSLTKEFTARVDMIYQTNPPSLALMTDIPGESELNAALNLLNLTDEEIDALANSQEVKGTYREKSEQELLQEIKDGRNNLSRIEILTLEPVSS